MRIGSVARAVGMMGLAAVFLACGGGGGGNSSPTAPQIPQVPSIDSILGMNVSIYPRSGSPTDVSLLVDQVVIKRAVWTGGCPSYLGVPLCVGIGGSVLNLQPGSRHTLTFKVNAQTKASITYDLTPAGTYMIQSQNVVQSIILSDKVAKLSAGQSVSWSFTLAK